MIPIIPEPTRPQMPTSYGVSGSAGMLDWAWAKERLQGAHNYWVITVRADARPHAVPVWGLWYEGAFYFGTDRSSVKARNAIANPAITIHLESGQEVVIVEGRAAEFTDAATIKKLNQEYKTKYGLRLTDAPGALILFAVRPRAVLAWREQDFNQSATRWAFE